MLGPHNQLLTTSLLSQASGPCGCGVPERMDYDWLPRAAVDMATQPSAEQQSRL
jgi:hypothetical protein